MATSREDARPLQRCGWRANGRLRYPTIYTTSWDTTYQERLEVGSVSASLLWAANGASLHAIDLAFLAALSGLIGHCARSRLTPWSQPMSHGAHGLSHKPEQEWDPSDQQRREERPTEGQRDDLQTFGQGSIYLGQTVCVILAPPLRSIADSATCVRPSGVHDPHGTKRVLTSTLANWAV